MRIKLVEVVNETVNKGKKPYTKSMVTYSNGQGNRTYQMVSFANPAVFNTIQECSPGDELEVTLTKNDKGYDTWAAVAKATGPAAASAAPPTGGRVVGSTYETKEERTDNRLRIVRQSALNYAINTLTPGAKAALKFEEVTDMAQRYVDWVYENDFEEIPGEQVPLQ